MVLRTLADNNPALIDDLVRQVVPVQYQQILDSYASLPDGGVAFWIALIGLLPAGTGLCSRCTRWSIRVFCVPLPFSVRIRPSVSARDSGGAVAGLAVVVVGGFLAASRWAPAWQQPMHPRGSGGGLSLLFIAPKICRGARSPTGRLLGASSGSAGDHHQSGGADHARGFSTTHRRFIGAMTTVVAFISRAVSG